MILRKKEASTRGEGNACREVCIARGRGAHVREREKRGRGMYVAKRDERDVVVEKEER